MRDRITEALKDHDAQYIEIRLEQSEGTHLQYRGKNLEEIGRTSGMGGNVRALTGGGWGFTCFNDLFFHFMSMFYIHFLLSNLMISSLYK